VKTLDELMILFDSDKGTKHSGVPHGYTPHYDRLFSPFRNKPIKFLEIGVGGGPSIRAWLEYFPKAQVFGVDHVKDTNPYNVVGSKEIKRYTFVHGDQSCSTFWACFLADYGSDWDIVVDDGSHVSKDIFTTFNALWPALKSGGLYAIEDLNCSYGGAGSHFTPLGSPTHMEWIRGLMDGLNLDTVSDLDWLHFSRELIVMCKK